MGKSKLMDILRLGDLNKLRQYLANGRNSESFAKNGDAALILCVQQGDYFATKLLLEKGANVNVRNTDSHTVLMLAAGLNFHNIVRLLIIYGASVDDTDKEGRTALFHSCRENATLAAKILILKGAKVNHLSLEGYTPLIFACYFDCKDAALLLLRKGAKVDMCGKFGATALMFSAHKKAIDCATILLHFKANVNFQDDYNFTPLDWALYHNAVEIQQLLKKKGGVQGKYLKVKIQSKQKSVPGNSFSTTSDASTTSSDVYESSENYQNENDRAFDVRKSFENDSAFSQGQGFGLIRTPDSPPLSPIPIWPGVPSHSTPMASFNGDRNSSQRSSFNLDEFGFEGPLQNAHANQENEQNENEELDVIPLDYPDYPPIDYDDPPLTNNNLPAVTNNPNSFAAPPHKSKGALTFGKFRSNGRRPRFPHASDSVGWGSLRHRAKHDREQLVNDIIAEDVDLNDPVDNKKTPPLTYAILQNARDMVNLFLDKRLTVDFKQKDVFGKTPLMYAVERNLDDIVKLVSERDIDIDDVDLMKNTALMLSVATDNEKVTQILLDKNASFTTEIGGKTAMDCAAASNAKASLKLMLKRLGRYSRPFLSRSLLFAARYDAQDTAKMLLRAGANPQASDSKGRTALFHTTVSDSVVVAAVLVTKGADVNARDIDQVTPVMAAAYFDATNVYKLVVREGANLSCVDKDGKGVTDYRKMGCGNQ